MKYSYRRLCAALAGAGLVAAVPAAWSQTTPSDRGPSAGSASDGYSLLPWTRRGYVGINLGQSKYKTGCGTPGFACDDSDTSGRIYTGGMFSEYLGAEIGYLHMGRVERAGGRTDAQGLNLSLVGRVPIGAFNVFAKGGATYGRTRVSSDLLSGVPSGTEKGWGRSYGVGAGYDFTPRSGVVLEWERHRFDFAGDVKDDVESTTLGYVHRF
jgi:OOP family OmpA-OmpF porin